jgi:hypothetical protein
MASFNIIRHQTRNWELRTKLVQNKASFENETCTKQSFISSFILLECLHCTAATYIFTAPTCTTLIIIFKPCEI